MDPKKNENIFKNEIRVFNLLKNIILSNIQEINTHFQTKGLDEEYRNIIIIIAGGSAFEYYFTNAQGDSLLQTTDFDIRFSYKGQDFSEKIIEKLFDIRNQVTNHFCKVLNDYIVNSIDPEAENIRKFIAHSPDGKFFYVNTNILDTKTDFSKLKSISYDIIDNGMSYITSIIDSVVDDRIMDSSGPKNSFLNKSNEEIYEGFFKYSIDSDNVKYPSQDGLTGFLNNDISLPESYISISSHYPEFNNVYIVSLSYLLWDTFKMINICILKSKYVDEVKVGEVRGIDINNIDYEKNKYIESLKLKRYIYKYSEIIKAFEEPEKLLSCKAPNMKDYIIRCGVGQKLGSVPITSKEPYRDTVTVRMYPTDEGKIELSKKYNY